MVIFLVETNKVLKIPSSKVPSSIEESVNLRVLSFCPTTENLSSACVPVNNSLLILLVESLTPEILWALETKLILRLVERESSDKML